jgi:hypothetical protein
LSGIWRLLLGECNAGARYAALHVQARRGLAMGTVAKRFVSLNGG